MTNWTPEAKQNLDEYLGEIRALSQAQGDDAQEIVDDLRVHITTETEDASGSVVTLDHLRRTLAALGTPAEVVGGSGSTAERAPRMTPSAQPGTAGLASGSPVAQGPYGSRARTLIYLFALGLPIFALGFEILLGAMAELYIDPIPTMWHVAAGVLLLLSIGTVDHFLKKARDGHAPKWAGWAFFLNSYAFALSLVYFLVYIPILPVSIIALIAYGLGLMGFAPMACMIASGYQMKMLFRFLPELGVERQYATRRAILGSALVALLVAGYAGPEFVGTRVLQMTLSEDAATRDRGIWWIETLNLENELLKACYAPVVRGIGPTRRWDTQDIDNLTHYRELYFRLTGTPYNSVPRPNIRSTFRTRSVDWWEEERSADSEVGGTAVAGRVHGLSLNASHLDGKIMRLGADPSSPALGYFEWTIEFKNVSDRQREARAQIELPHGGVASRLTLWIDGEDREAAFGTRQQVREAYQQVAVVQRRDPALLNVVGPDTLLLQCFPIQPGSTMKLKMGITAPLIVRDGKSYLRMPFISERNFTIAPEFEHVSWVECDPGITASAPRMTQEAGARGSIALHARMKDADIQRGDAVIVVESGSPAAVRYAGQLGAIFGEMTTQGSPAAPSAPLLCVVVDGSSSKEHAHVDWAAFVDALPDNARVDAVFAGHAVEVFSDVPIAPSAALSDWLGTREYRGGCDPLPGIERALDIVGSQGGAILWVHGPLPVELSSVESLRQWERWHSMRGDEGALRVLAVEAVPGPNRALEQLGRSAFLERVPVLGTLDETLRYTATHLTGADVAQEYAVATTMLPGAPLAEGLGSAHLVRLAVNDEVRKAMLSHDASLQRETATLAVEARLVTPLTGAVVLERKEQYERHGLDPTKHEEAIPGIPEPEEWALLLVVLAMLLMVAVRQTRARMLLRN
ncbi:MAG: hypothetical protein IT364_00245 [Candidatus Hydrogenedentes bacterium]|nr:hypothetical protein [Candidatus Hydrogenedentota bacterium]